MPLTVRSVVGARRPLRRDPLADAGVVVHGRPGPQDRRPVDTRRREGAAEGRDPRRQPGALLRAQAAVHARGRGERRAGRLGEAAVVREGRDVTLVTAMKSVHDSLEAADELEADRVSVEVDRPADAAAVRPRDRPRVGAEDESDRGRRGGAADGRLGGRGARLGRRAWPRRPRRRLADRDPRTRRSRTARRSRTRSSPGPERIAKEIRAASPLSEPAPSTNGASRGARRSAVASARSESVSESAFVSLRVAWASRRASSRRSSSTA